VNIVRSAHGQARPARLVSDAMRVALWLIAAELGMVLSVLLLARV
jgi:hypothetical protein